MSDLIERGEQIITRVQVEALYRERAELERRLDDLLAVEAIEWRALTDVLIGAQQQSQSHADVIALVADALIQASAIVPLEKRAGWAVAAQDGDA